jgi:hypothetical protein
MKEKYEPSTDFVLKVMRRVYEYEESRIQSFNGFLLIHQYDMQ